jgi:hypothetical protein
MKASAEKSSTSSVATATRAASQPFFAKAAGGEHFFTPVKQTAAPAVQFKMTVSQPGDKFEQEADKTATKVMRLPTPAAPEKEEKLQRQTDERLQKAARPEEKIQKQEAEKLQKAPRPLTPASNRPSTPISPAANRWRAKYAAIWSLVSRPISATCASTATRMPLNSATA